MPPDAPLPNEPPQPEPASPEALPAPVENPPPAPDDVDEMAALDRQELATLSGCGSLGCLIFFFIPVCLGPALNTRRYDALGRALEISVTMACIMACGSNGMRFGKGISRTCGGLALIFGALYVLGVVTYGLTAGREEFIEFWQPCFKRFGLLR